MRNRQNGFSLLEVLITMVIFSVIIIAASQTFVNILTNAKTQGKMVASNIEGMLGLEVLRRDITHAGYGLYWQVEPKSAPTATPTYVEVSTDANGIALNDAPAGNPPRALVFGAGRGLNGSDWIAVKSLNVVANMQSEHWTYLYTSPTVTLNTWSPAAENIGATDYVIVVRPDQTYRYLMFTSDVSKNFYSRYQDVVTSYTPDSTGIVFSMGTSNIPRMPFNRADFYISNAGVPGKCATGSGVLYKSVVNQSTASTGYLPAIPLLDCVADMQVSYRFDSDGDGYADTDADVTADQPIDATSARQIREVRIYILAQEGQRDKDYTYPNGTVRVGETGFHNFGRDFNLAATVADWQRYRWKLYTLIIEPITLVDWTVIP